MSTAAVLGYLAALPRPGWTWPAPRASPWETRRARVGCLVSIRSEQRRDGPWWVVVAHDSATPAEGRARGDLRVLYDASDEHAARAKVAEVCGDVSDPRSPRV